MGQYYKCINIEAMEWVGPRDYDNGLKLMEHSYIGNTFITIVMKLLSKGGRWYKKPIVWCGDYFDQEGEEDYYHKVEDRNKIKPNTCLLNPQTQYILVNHTKKQYVFVSEEDYNLTKAGLTEANKMLKVIEAGDDDDDELKIHPLPLLTALGNGRGGGDFRGDNEYVGYWARDVLSVELEIPDKEYKQLNVEFIENE